MNVYSPSTSAADWIRAFGAGELLSDGPPDLVIVDGPVAADRPVPPIEEFPERSTIYEFRPNGFREVLKQVIDLGRLLGRSREAMQLIGEKEKRLTEIRVRSGAPKRMTGDQPRLTYVEHGGSRRTPSSWIDDLIEKAGALPLHIDLRQMDIGRASDMLFGSDPNALLIAPDAPGEEFVRQFLRHAASRSEWTSLRAVRDDRVYRVDDPAWMDDPGPRMYRAVELLCRALYGARSGVELDEKALQRVRIRLRAGE